MSRPSFIYMERQHLGPHDLCFIRARPELLPFTLTSLLIPECASKLTPWERVREFFKRASRALKRPWQLHRWRFVWPPKVEDRRTVHICVDEKYVTPGPLPIACFSPRAFPIKLGIPTAHKFLSIALENHSSKPVSFHATLIGKESNA